MAAQSKKISSSKKTSVIHHIHHQVKSSRKIKMKNTQTQTSKRLPGRIAYNKWSQTSFEDLDLTFLMNCKSKIADSIAKLDESIALEDEEEKIKNLIQDLMFDLETLFDKTKSNPKLFEGGISKKQKAKASLQKFLREYAENSEFSWIGQVRRSLECSMMVVLPAEQLLDQIRKFSAKLH